MQCFEKSGFRCPVGLELRGKCYNMVCCDAQVEASIEQQSMALAEPCTEGCFRFLEGLQPSVGETMRTRLVVLSGAMRVCDPITEGALCRAKHPLCFRIVL